ncbi:tetratricopeptide repeat-containing glycosyltransferase family 2 protein [Paenibacillus soyae]|uniref:Glycosyltransferase n=1 Tax=Paenibacillus soyae TaxID=2969249 RepID=A0A9X2MVR5_9BACL|nr:glycosyltransferase [Paenibacillus soyae]MCR2806731.1 glycosyltransferase [Paenibacillus soyae]
MSVFTSLCLIVKDEEKVLRRCLESVSGIVDEIILVDTGSSDNTKEIAAEFTDHIYHYDWTNNFAEARNFAASKANGQWILVLDADEYVDRDNLQASIDELKKDAGAYDVYATNILNFLGEDGTNIAQNRHARVYKNNGEIQYFRAIHEQLESTNPSGINMGVSSLLIYHTGYMKSVVREKGKSGRNLQIIDKEMNAKSDEAFDLYNYGNEMSVLGHPEKALDAYIKAYQKKTSFHHDWVPVCLLSIVEKLIALERYNDALTVIQDAGAMFSDAADFQYYRGLIYFRQKRYDEAKAVFSHIVLNAKHFTRVIKSPDFKDYIPSKALAFIYEEENNFQSAVKYHTSALNHNRYCLETLYRLIKILTKFHTEAEIFTFLSEKVLSTPNTEVLRKLVAFALNIGKPALAQRLVKRYFAADLLMNRAVDLKAGLSAQSNTPITAELYDAPVLVYGLKLSMLDYADLFLLYFATEDAGLRSDLKKLLSNESLISLLEAVENNESLKGKNVNAAHYVNILEKCIVFNQFELFNKLVPLRTELTDSVGGKIAGLLYRSGYVDESIEFYSEADENDLDEQDFENVIKWLISKDNGSEAQRISMVALKKYKFNFYFHKQAINLSVKRSLINQKLVKKAKEIFGETEWLAAYSKS